MGGFDNIDLMIGLGVDRHGLVGRGEQEDGGQMSQDPAKELEKGHDRLGIWWQRTRGCLRSSQRRAQRVSVMVAL